MKKKTYTLFCKDFRQDYRSVKKISNKENLQDLKLAKHSF